MAQTLIISSQPVVDGPVLARLLEGGVSSLQSVSFVTNSSALPAGALPSETYGIAFSFAEDAGSHGAQLLAELFRSLKHGGTLTIVEKDHKDTSMLEKQLVLAGFIGCKRDISPNGDAMVEAQKPTWQIGSSAPIRLTSAAKQNQAAEDKGPQKLRLDLAEGNDNDDLIDEDALLTAEDRQRPDAAADCGAVTTKKACKNCTCGRAEGRMEKVDLTPQMLENPQSGCGSCGLGDAFRCQTCPYRGLPAFEKGKRIELPQDFLTADA